MYLVSYLFSYLFIIVLNDSSQLLLLLARQSKQLNSRMTKSYQSGPMLPYYALATIRRWTMDITTLPSHTGFKFITMTTIKRAAVAVMGVLIVRIQKCARCSSKMPQRRILEFTTVGLTTK